MHIRLPKAMTISGADSSSGAGIQADLGTFSAFGVYGVSVVTAITAQNTVEVAAIAEVPEEVVIAQIDSVLEDIGADAVKTGMLSSRHIIENVADRLEAWGVPWLVVDPVIQTKAGVQLLQPGALAAFANDLLPHATVITPNITEAEILSGIRISSEHDLRTAAIRIAELGPRIVVIKGGNLDGPAVDLIYDGSDFAVLESARIPAEHTHGAGCVFSAAITAMLALGVAPDRAIALAKQYVEESIRTAVVIGEGRSPVNHAAPLPDEIAVAIKAPAR